MTYLNHSYICFGCGGILRTDTPKYPPERVHFKNYHWYCGNKVFEENKRRKEEENDKERKENSL